MQTLKAKDCSLAAKIIAAIIMVTGCALKWVGVLPETVSVDEIAKCSFTVMLIFIGVDVNLVMEKLRDKKDTSSGSST